MIGRISELRAGHLCLLVSESKLCTTGPLMFNSYSTTTLACGHKNGLFFHRNEIKLLATALVVLESLVVTVRRRISATSSLNAISTYYISWKNGW
jgi:hypothetical protein